MRCTEMMTSALPSTAPTIIVPKIKLLMHNVRTSDHSNGIFDVIGRWAAAVVVAAVIRSGSNVAADIVVVAEDEGNVSLKNSLPISPLGHRSEMLGLPPVLLLPLLSPDGMMPVKFAVVSSFRRSPNCSNSNIVVYRNNRR